MGERLIDLDAAPSSAPFKGWSRRNSLTLVVAVLAVVAAILAALAWPEPRPVPEVVGLRQTPVPAWTLAGAAYPAGTCGDRGLVTSDESREGFVVVACLGLDDGRTRWESTYELDGGFGWVTMLPGTGYLTLQGERSIRLLDARTGELVDRIDFDPLGDERPVLVASDKGTPFYAEPTWGELEPEWHLSRLNGTDPDDRVWDVQFGNVVAGWLAVGSPTESHGLAWFRGASIPLARGFSLAVDLEDGTIPEWSRQLHDMVLLDGVVIGSSGTDLRAVSVGSGRTLWERDEWREEPVASGDALYATQSPDSSEVDPRWGPVEGKLVRLDPHTGRVIWNATFPHPVGAVATFGDVVLAIDQAGWETTNVPFHLTAVDPETGAARWTREFEGEWLSDLKWGEEQVLVMLPTGGDWGEDMRVIALDLATGETRWELDPEGYPFVIGGRLVTDDNDGFVVYR